MSQQVDQLFECSEYDEFDVNTKPMTFHPVVKDAGVLCGLHSVARLWCVTRDAVLAALVMCLEGREYVLALWIVVQGIGSVVEYVLTHVEDMLAGGYSDVCWSDGSGIQRDI